MLGNRRHELSTDFVKRSPLLKDELSTFAEQEHGKLEAEAGCFDDRVMGMAVGLMGAKRAGYLLQHEDYQRTQDIYVDPFSVAGIITELQARGTSDDALPIPRQDIGALH